MKTEKFFRIILIGFLILLIVFGIGSRFYKVAWDSDALLHPDEYGLTNTLTQLSIPGSLSNYFNTRISVISPYNKYDENGTKTSDGPDNRMRWGQLPIIIIRAAAEAFNQTGYTEMRKLGRVISALMDVGALILLYFIGRILFKNRMIPLLAVTLSSLTVLEIQQSHFMTVDNFAVFFTMLTLLAAVKVSDGLVFQWDEEGKYQITHYGKKWFILFGIFLGMTVACKINLAVLAVMLIIAAFVQTADLPLRTKHDPDRLLGLVVLWGVVAAVSALVAFRIFQPMSFRAARGDTSVFTLHFNQDWWDSMQVAASESKGIGGGPPSEQWAHRIPILFPLVNMVFYGMGVPLGITVWLAAIAAILKIFKTKQANYKIFLIPVFWALFFFSFMGTRFVKCIRYILPAYPCFSLLGAWGLYSLWHWGKAKKGWHQIFSTLICILVLGGTFTWAYTFAKTIYGQDHSRVEATRWIYQNIPAEFQLHGTDLTAGKEYAFGIPAEDDLTVSESLPFSSGFSSSVDTQINQIEIPHIRSLSSNSTVMLEFSFYKGGNDGELVYQADKQVDVSENEKSILIPLGPFNINAGTVYQFNLKVLDGSSILLRRTVLANENWDEGLPFRLDGYDPFGQFYTGLTNEVRWADSEDKKQMFLKVMEQSDYLIMPSQRAVWSACRIPLTYPMTMSYYHGLFDGSLGFTLVAEFQRPFQIGNLYISDLAGKVGWGAAPDLPIENLSLWSSEEAFSVYDHPPVWIFKKNSDFNLDTVKAYLDRTDLTKVVIQGPTNAVWPEK